MEAVDVVLGIFVGIVVGFCCGMWLAYSSILKDVKAGVIAIGRKVYTVTEVKPNDV